MSLKNFWYVAAESRELSRAPISRVLFNDHFVLFRNQKGLPVVLEDRCAHRNIALSTGEVRNGCIQCPYHGWTYDQDGNCVAIPSLGAEAKLPAIRVRSIPSSEQDGFIWVFTGETSKAQNVPIFNFPKIREKGWTTFIMKTRFQATVEACLENFLDCPHTVFVHKGWFRNPDARELTAIVKRTPMRVEVEFQNEPICKSVVSRLLFPKGRELRHVDRFIMPNISCVDYQFTPDRHYFITSQCTPINDRETEVYTAITYRFGAVGRLVRLIFQPLCQHIIRQDVEILRAQSGQLQRLGGPSFSHCETDLLGLHIQSMRRNCEDHPEKEEIHSRKQIKIRF